jgi:hypothetical protein
MWLCSALRFAVLFCQMSVDVSTTNIGPINVGGLNLLIEIVEPVVEQAVNKILVSGRRQATAPLSARTAHRLSDPSPYGCAYSRRPAFRFR